MANLEIIVLVLIIFFVLFHLILYVYKVTC